MFQTKIMRVCVLLSTTFLITVAQQQDCVIALTFMTCNSYSYTITEGASQSLCAVLLYINGSSTLQNNYTVQFVPVNGSATSPQDFPNIIQYVTFTAGTSPGKQLCVNIATIDDTNVENQEQFTVNLLPYEPASIKIGDRALGGTATIAITDNDAATYGLYGNYSVYESAGTLQVCVVLYIGILDIVQSVSVKNNAITATVGADYNSATGTVSFLAGSVPGATACESITILEDTIVENNETLSVTITTSTKVLVGSSNTTAYVTIIDNDYAVFGMYSTNVKQNTETNTPITVCVSITNTVTLAVSVSINVGTRDITATSGVDYLPPAAPTITYISGAAVTTPMCTSFQLLQDNIVENNENLTVYLYSTMAPQVQVSASADSYVFTIIEDGDTVVIGFVSSTQNTSEHSNVSICAQIKSGDVGIRVSATVSTTALGTATAYVDYVPLTLAQIVFNPGSSNTVNSTSCCTLQILDDDAVETDETVSLTISGSIPVNIQVATNTLILTIYEDTTDYVTIGLGNSFSVTEGVNLTATVCATISYGSLQISVSGVAYTTNISATPSVDYESKRVTLSFTAGMQVGSSVCFTIGIYNDLVLEDTKIFSVTLQSSDPRLVVASGKSQLNITIYNNPSDVITLGFQNNEYRAIETNLLVSVCILMLSGKLGKDIPIAIYTTDQTAIGGVDYISLNTTIVLTSGMIAGNTLCINIELVNDNIIEPTPESFLVTITDNDPSAIIEKPTTTVYIQD